MTGKFRGGVNPFTRGCYGNVEHVLCSPLAPRYVVEAPRMPLSVSLKPPFLRPELLERAVPLKVKLSDNGLKAGRSKVGVWTGTVRLYEWTVGCRGGDRKKR